MEEMAALIRHMFDTFIGIITEFWFWMIVFFSIGFGSHWY
tara:strand:- start:475 stop:594 length:120 start_codon:yes stop_codon:yes gene_type:complete